MKTGSTRTRSSARANVAPLFLVVVLVSALWRSAVAQDAEELAKQQQEVMRQYMEAAGMSAEDIAKNEALLKGSMAPIVKEQAAREAQEQAEFEAQTAGLGKAAVSILGKNMEMRITRCETGEDGEFFVEAKQGADRRKGHLTLRGDSHYNRTQVQLLSPGVGLYEAHISPILMLDDGRFSWTGPADGDRGRAELTIDLQCGDAS